MFAHHENGDVELRRKHSASHIMTAAVQMLYGKDIGLGVGPWTDEGFYQDFDLKDKQITDKDLKEIESKMRWIVNKNIPIKKTVVRADEALKLCAGDPYKTELVEEITRRGEEISFYFIGESLDRALSVNLCAGPHLESTGQLGVFKLTKIAGAYWRGDEKNKMLTRVYGVTFADKETLNTYITLVAEAEKRDHRKLGKELDLFTTSELIGAGLPLMKPKGMIVRQEIENFLWEMHRGRGYDRVWTPHIAKESLYVESGHATKFGDELFRVTGKEEKFIMKPMNCPHHMQIFADNQFSYRDMPVRYFELATVYRDEKSGQLGGLSRVRAITQDDGHLFCRMTQIEEEVSTIVGIINEFYTVFGMLEGYWVSLSVRGEDRSKYLGTDDAWETAEASLEKAAKANKLNYRRVEGEAAFYGPKLDFMFKDALGRERQLSTIQCDFNLPDRFDLSFINEKGEKERPVVIHRAISGSLERFMSVMIEHFAGAFPTWLSPAQVKVLPVSDKHTTYTNDVVMQMKAEGIRAEIDASSETLGKRIRNAKLQKTPYIVVIGDAEMESNTLAVESRDVKWPAPAKTRDFICQIAEEVKKRTLKVSNQLA